MTTIKKATLVEASLIGVSLITAAALARQLYTHNVNASVIAMVISLTVLAGANLAVTIGLGIRTTTYTCPTKGCPVSVRAQSANPGELARFRAYATDHTQHEARR